MCSACGAARCHPALLDGAYRTRANSPCRLIEALDLKIGIARRLLASRLACDPGCAAIQAIPGVGPILAAVFVAEIGDVRRFPNARHLCSWAGLTPKHRESGIHVHRRRITKQGSTLVRGAAVEAAQKIPASATWHNVPPPIQDIPWLSDRSSSPDNRFSARTMIPRSVPASRPGPSGWPPASLDTSRWGARKAARAPKSGKNPRTSPNQGLDRHRPFMDDQLQPTQ
jgi:hypothetical protein